MNKQRGFTLVETMLYLTIMTVVLGAVSSYIYGMMRAELRHRETSQLFQDADRVQRLITQDIQKAWRVLDPPILSTSSTLVLEQKDGTTVQYEFVSSGIWRSESALAPERITSPETVVREFSALFTATSSSLGLVNVTTTFRKGAMFANTTQTEYTLQSTAALRQ
jgi:type II secretory pathway pseudopilin PulG